MLAACGDDGGSSAAGGGGEGGSGAGGSPSGTGGSGPGSGGAGGAGGQGAACTPTTAWAQGFTALREIAVSPSGDDQAGDGSAGKPFASIAGALKAALPGDRITLAAGTYTCSNTSVDGAQGAGQGTLENPIWVRGEPGAVVDCGDPVNGSATALMLVGVKYVVIDGIEFTNAGAHILHVFGKSKGVLFTRVKAHRAGLACLKASQSDEINVEDSELADAGLSGDQGKSEGSGQIADYVGVHDSHLVRSKVHGAVGNGLGSAPNVAIQYKGGSHDIVIAQNDIWAAGTAVHLGGGTGAPYFDPPDASYEGKNIVAYANVVTGPMGVGFSAIGCHQCAIYNNTVYAPMDRQAIRALPGATPAGDASHTVDFTVKNNLFYFAGGSPQDLFNATPDDQAGIVQEANLFFAPGKPVSTIYTDIPVVSAPGAVIDKDPLLAGPPEDAHLSPGSPAISAGVPIETFTGDRTGACRKTWDIGAYAAP